MSLINDGINLFLTWSSTFVIARVNKETLFPISDGKTYFPVVTFSSQDNVKIWDHLKFAFKITINCNKYQSNIIIKQ